MKAVTSGVEAGIEYHHRKGRDRAAKETFTCVTVFPTVGLRGESHS